MAVVAEPVRSASDVERLVAHELGDASMITAAVGMVTAELATTPSGDASWTPLIGFAGAPFTLAAYLVEGRPSRDHLAARAMMHADPAAWAALMRWCADLSGAFLGVQVDAGASAVQLFDSWAGSLRLTDYTERVAPWSRRARMAAIRSRWRRSDSSVTLRSGISISSPSMVKSLTPTITRSTFSISRC